MKKKNKVLFVIWGILVVVVVTLLTILGFMLKNINKEYREVEDILKEKAEKYTSDNFMYPEEGKTIIVTKEELIEKGYLEKLEKDKDTCEGYVVVSTKKVVNYKAYIKCGKYTTDGYIKENK